MKLFRKTSSKQPKTVARSKGSYENTDAKKRLLIRKRLDKLSQLVRREEIASANKPKEEPKKREAIPAPPPKARVEPDVQSSAPAPLQNKPEVKVTLTKSVTKSPQDNEQTETPEEKKKWGARAFFGRHLPVLQCNSCSISRVCPQFKAGYECAFLPYLHNHKVTNEVDLVKYMKLMVGNSMRRAQLMSLTEAANGGMPSVETSEALDMAFRQLKELHDVIGTKEKEEVSMTSSDTTLIGSLFGGMKLSTLHADTKKMKNLSLVPMEVPNAPGVPQTLAPVRLPDSSGVELPNDVSADLIKDVLLSRDPERKSLQSGSKGIIEQDELRKT